MSTVTGKRVSERGRVTGSADLVVERHGDTVHVKLGMTRIQVPAQAWAALVRPTLEAPKLPGTYDGYTTDQLKAAWQLVKPAGDWKGPIDAVVPAGTNLDAIYAACSFFAGTPADVQPAEGGWRVTGAGYCACIGS
jgi:hypothetical protein